MLRATLVIQITNNYPLDSEKRLKLNQSAQGTLDSYTEVLPENSLSEDLMWTPSFGQENAETKLGSQALLD